MNSEARLLPDTATLFSPTLERALRRAATWHAHQKRKGGDLPYIQHPVAVAMILDRQGWPEDVVIAGLLHDAVEDTDATLDDVRHDFNDHVAELVAYCSEHKTDASGVARPWADRKRDHIAALEAAPAEARAIALADKLHNLASIRHDLIEERKMVHTIFNAPWSKVLDYYRTCIGRYPQGEPRLEFLAEECCKVLAEIESHSAPKPGEEELRSGH